MENRLRKYWHQITAKMKQKNLEEEDEGEKNDK
jgi:hypothetical protein